MTTPISGLRASDIRRRPSLLIALLLITVPLIALPIIALNTPLLHAYQISQFPLTGTIKTASWNQSPLNSTNNLVETGLGNFQIDIEGGAQVGDKVNFWARADYRQHTTTESQIENTPVYIGSQTRYPDETVRWMVATFAIMCTVGFILLIVGISRLLMRIRFDPLKPRIEY